MAVSYDFTILKHCLFSGPMENERSHPLVSRNCPARHGYSSMRTSATRIGMQKMKTNALMTFLHSLMKRRGT